MGFLLLLILLVPAMILLGWHSYHTRGARITFNFFFFAFLWTFIKEMTGPYSAVGPYEFFLENSSPNLILFSVVLGWIFAFYVSWALAEKILEKTPFFNRGLFPTALLATWIVLTVSYATEATSISWGWWRWKVVFPYSPQFLIKGFPYNALLAWGDVTFYFLVPFLLMECSRYKNYVWKAVFLILPVCYRYFYLVRGYFVVQNLFAWTVVLLAFFNQLQLEYFPKEENNSSRRKFIEKIPLVLAGVFAVILVFIDVLVLRKPLLLLTVLPFIICILAAVESIPLWGLLIVGGGGVLLQGPLAVPSLGMTIFIICFYITDRLRGKKKSALRGSGLIICFLCFCSLYYLVFSPLDRFSALPVSGEKVTVSGEVVYPDYQKGIIKIGVWSHALGTMHPPRLARTQISQPGDFTIDIPVSHKSVYMYAVNIPKSLPFWIRIDPRRFPWGEYKGNPLDLTSDEVGNIKIQLEQNVRKAGPME